MFKHNGVRTNPNPVPAPRPIVPPANPYPVVTDRYIIQDEKCGREPQEYEQMINSIKGVLGSGEQKICVIPAGIGIIGIRNGKMERIV